MPYKGHKAVTVTDEDYKKLWKITEVLKARSMSAVASLIISKAYKRIVK
jgi:hypothetical protein